VVLTTKDPQAAIDRVFVRVPSSAPFAVEAHVPALDDPRLAEAVLEVVDATTREPIPDAVVEWDPVVSPLVTQRGDSRGRVKVAIPHVVRGGLAALRALQSSRVCVHAPGFRPSAQGPSNGLEGDPITFPEAVLREWLDRGTWRVALERLPADEGYVEREVRLTDSSGAPVAGAFVFVVRDFPPQAVRVLRELGAAVSSEDFTFSHGFRRSGRDGVIRFPMLERVGLEMRVGGVPFAAWGLSKEEWPAEGPRDLRVPDRSDVEISIAGLPDPGGLSWSRDRLGAARTFADGPTDGRRLVLDGPAARDVEAGAEFFVWYLDSAGGRFDSYQGSIRIPLAVGSPTRLYLDSGRETRVLDVTPATAGGTKVTRTWGDLPLANDAK
jgi:hypothetical protein